MTDRCQHRHFIPVAVVDEAVETIVSFIEIVVVVIVVAGIT